MGCTSSDTAAARAALGLPALPGPQEDVADRVLAGLQSLDPDMLHPCQAGEMDRLRQLLERGIQPRARDLLTLSGLCGVGIEVFLLGRRLDPV